MILRISIVGLGIGCVVGCVIMFGHPDHRIPMITTAVVSLLMGLAFGLRVGRAVAVDRLTELLAREHGDRDTRYGNPTIWAAQVNGVRLSIQCLGGLPGKDRIRYGPDFWNPRDLSDVADSKSMRSKS